jgi:hypothetical protein
MYTFVKEKLVSQFDRLFVALRRLKAGPPEDLEGFIRGRPPVGELPPASMTLLLIAAAYFLRAHRVLGEWLAEHLPLAEGSNSDTDAGHPQAEITELKIKFDDVRFSVILDRDSRSREYRHEFVSSDGDTDTCNTEGRVPYAFPDLKSLADFVVSNSWDDLLGRLRECAELGLDDRCDGWPEKPYGGMIRSFSDQGILSHLATLALCELDEVGILALLDSPGHYPPTSIDDHEYKFRLGEAARAHVDVLDEFHRQWSNPHMRLWLSGLVGDWEAAHAYAVATGKDDLAAWMLPRAEQCRRNSLATLRSRMFTPNLWELRIDDDTQALLGVELQDLPMVRCEPIVVEPSPRIVLG